MLNPIIDRRNERDLLLHAHRKQGVLVLTPRPYLGTLPGVIFTLPTGDRAVIVNSKLPRAERSKAIRELVRSN